MKIFHVHEIKGQIHLTLDDNFCILLPNQGTHTPIIKEALTDVMKRQVTFDDIQISATKLLLVNTSYDQNLYTILHPSKSQMVNVRSLLEKAIHLPPPLKFPKDER